MHQQGNENVAQCSDATMSANGSDPHPLALQDRGFEASRRRNLPECRSVMQV